MNLAPVVDERPGSQSGGIPDEVEVFERNRIAATTNDEVLRGFTGKYRSFDEELKTDVDVDALVQDLKESLAPELESSTALSSLSTS